MKQNSRWLKSGVAVVLAALVLVVQAGLMAQNLGTAPQVNVAVQGEQATQPEGTFLNLINWIGNVIAPVGAGGAALLAIGSFAMGRGFAKWVFTANRRRTDRSSKRLRDSCSALARPSKSLLAVRRSAGHAQSADGGHSRDGSRPT